MRFYPKFVRHGLGLRLAASLLLLSISTGSQAEEVTFFFQGTLTQNGSFSTECGGAKNSGTPFAGSFTFESTTPDIHPAPQQSIHPEAIVAASLQLDGVSYSLVDGAVQFQDNYSADPSLCGGSPHDQLGYSVNVTGSMCRDTFAFSISRVDCGGGLVNGTEMPLQPPPTAYMPFEFVMTSAGGVVLGSVSSMTLQGPVSVEPSTWGRIKRQFATAPF